MRCLACKSDTRVDATTTYFAQVSSGYVIIENVPCKKCTQCGEEFFSASVVECIEQILDKNNLYNHWLRRVKTAHGSPHSQVDLLFQTIITNTFPPSFSFQFT